MIHLRNGSFAYVSILSSIYSERNKIRFSKVKIKIGIFGKVDFVGEKKVNIVILAFSIGQQ